MLTHDRAVASWFDAHDTLRYVVDAVLVVGVVGVGWWKRNRVPQA